MLRKSSEEVEAIDVVAVVKSTDWDDRVPGELGFKQRPSFCEGWRADNHDGC